MKRFWALSLEVLLGIGFASGEEVVAGKLEGMGAGFEELRADLFSAQEKFDARYVGELEKLEERSFGEGNWAEGEPKENHGGVGVPLNPKGELRSSAANRLLPVICIWRD